MMRYLSLLAGYVAFAGLVYGDEPTDATKTHSINRTTKSYESKGWLIQESQTFRVCCGTSLAASRRLPEACEALRRQLQETWFGEASGDWSPKCEIVVHPTVSEYVRELGPGSRQSSGCATVEVEGGKVVKRRIDLRADADDWMTSALPHEMTHVVLAEKFTRKQIPRWANEGMAILSEPAARQATRRAAMQRALATTGRFAAAELVVLADYPAASRRDAFYGESASLVAYLIERDSPARFLEFLQVAERESCERALKEVYRIGSLSELDIRWRPQFLDHGQSAELFASRIARITSGGEID